MMRSMLLTLILTLLLVAPVVAQSSTITVSLNCRGNPEKVTVRNEASFDVIVQLLKASPAQSDDDIFEINQILAAGESVTYFSGDAALRGDPNTLTGKFIFDDQANDGAGIIIGTPDAIVGLDVNCREGSKTFDATTGKPIGTDEGQRNEGRGETPTEMPDSGGGGMAPGSVAIALGHMAVVLATLALACNAILKYRQAV